MYAKLGYPSVKDFRWVFHIKHIVDCPVTVQDIEIENEICGKNITDLKGYISRKKPTDMAGDIFIIPKELIELHKDVFMTADILFVNGIPFFFF